MTDWRDRFAEFVGVNLVGFFAGLFAGKIVMNFAGYAGGAGTFMATWAFVLLVYYKLIRVRLNLSPFPH